MPAPEPADHAGARRRRLFFALWPPPAARTALARATRRAVRRSGGRPVGTRDLHITLAFVGAVEPARLDALLQLQPPASEPFELTLDRLGFWERSRILWLAPARVPAPLPVLERRLWDRLQAQGFRREPRPYVPHVTLARRGRAVREPVRAVRWPVAEFALVESLPAGTCEGRPRYRPLRFWPLAP